MLQTTMPGVKIHAEHYPPGTMNRMFSTLVSAAQYGVIFGAMLGQTASDAVAGTPLATPLAYVQQNKLQACGFAWFMGSSLSTSMLKTGAFEVQIRDGVDEPITVWSGLKRGGRPPPGSRRGPPRGSLPTARRCTSGEGRRSHRTA